MIAMGETALISSMSTTLNFSNNNHVVFSSVPPKKPPRKSSSEYVSDSDEELEDGQIYGEPISGTFVKHTDDNETLDSICTKTPDIHGNEDKVVNKATNFTAKKVQSHDTTKDAPSIPTHDDRPATFPAHHLDTPIKDRKLALEKSIMWLRQELLNMRKTDQTLIMQLMNIQMKIHSLKTEVFSDSPIVTRRTVYENPEVCADSPSRSPVVNRRRPIYQQQPSEELFDIIAAEEDVIDEKDFLVEDTELDLEEENGEPVAWREFQRRLSCRRTFSKRGKLPGIIKETSQKS